MLKDALKLLNQFEEKGYKAYIVGGFVRDYVLGINSEDVDIATSATPKEIMQEKIKNKKTKYDNLYM